MLKINNIPYRKPKLSRDYFLKDHMFDNAEEIRERCLSRTDWVLGAPYRQENWPGMRCPNGLLPDELEKLEEWVKKKTGAKRLWQQTVDGVDSLSHNYVQLVGKDESGPRPHSDSNLLARYAGIVYLTPDAPRDGGTSFYRFRFPDGKLGGNYCPAPNANLAEALGIRHLPIEAWKEDIAIENLFNRVVIYKAEMIHSATNYFGAEMNDKRMTIVFFWMAE